MHGKLEQGVRYLDISQAPRKKANTPLVSFSEICPDPNPIFFLTHHGLDISQAPRLKANPLGSAFLKFVLG